MGVRGLSQWVQLCTWSPNNLLRSNSIFNLWTTPYQESNLSPQSVTIRIRVQAPKLVVIVYWSMISLKLHLQDKGYVEMSRCTKHFVLLIFRSRHALKKDASTLYRKYDLCLPRWNCAASFLHSCISERFIYPQDRSATKEVDRSLEYIRYMYVEMGDRTLNLFWK